MLRTSHSNGQNGLSEPVDNFRLLRVITALAVASTHCIWVIYGQAVPTELQFNILMQASHCGICIFFAISGYLITNSLLERPNLVRFAVARIMRLCPLLIIASIVMAFIVGPLLTSASFAEYYSDWRVWAYVPVTALFYPDLTLPGLFDTLPAQGEVNVSVWTLRYEVLAYIGIAMLTAVGLLHHRLFAYAALGAALIYLYISFGTELRSAYPLLQHGLRFGMIFLMGSVICRYSHIIPLRFFGVVFVIGLAGATNNLAIMEPFRLLALSYTAIWLGLKSSPLLAGYNRLGDYSYGISYFIGRSPNPYCYSIRQLVILIY